MQFDNLGESVGVLGYALPGADHVLVQLVDLNPYLDNLAAGDDVMREPTQPRTPHVGCHDVAPMVWPLRLDVTCPGEGQIKRQIEDNPPCG